jgi:pectinesterase
MTLRNGGNLFLAFVVAGGALSWAQTPKTITVGAAGADFTTIQAAVNAAPDTGAVIRIQPGTYREVVHVDKPKIQFRGDGNDQTKVVLVFGNSAASTCGTGCSATLFVTGDDFFAGNMTIANDYSKTTDVPSQAVALSLRADRAVLRQCAVAWRTRHPLCVEHWVHEWPEQLQDRQAILLRLLHRGACGLYLR